jgi:glycerol-3-phosphate O-acyltransferase
MADIVLPGWLFFVLLALALTALLDRLLVPERPLVHPAADAARHRGGQHAAAHRDPSLPADPQAGPDRPAAARHEGAGGDRGGVRGGGVPRDVVVQRVERYAREIVPAFNAYAYFRLGYALARRLARLLYRVRLGHSDEEGLAAIRPGSTVVFVMNHRSNMDYVLVAYLAADRAALSYAVGEWARIWPLQTLIRSMGAYFVRRSSGDPLYRRVLERYVCMATAAGVTQALYPEGGLTRDGRLRAPKLGLLDYLLRGYEAAAGERDLVFVPVGINYDRTLEDRTLLLDAGAGRAAAGGLRAPRAPTLAFLWRNLGLMLRSRWHRFGYACVNFGTPISTRAYLERRGVGLRTLPQEGRMALVESLGRELMEAVGGVVPVLPVSLVATAFVEDPERRWTALELKAHVFHLMQRLGDAGAHIYLPRKDEDYAIDVGLRMLVLRRLIEERDGLFRAAPPELPVLRYYANSIVHLLPGRDPGPSLRRGRKTGHGTSTTDSPLRHPIP